VSGYFGFGSSVSGRVEPVIESSSVGFRIVSVQFGLVIRSSSVRLFRVLNHIRLDWIRSD
jgi:hypothetical protein